MKKQNIFQKLIGADEFKVIIPLAVVILVTTIFRPTFMNSANWISMYSTIPFIAIIALGAMFPLATGNVDISTGRVAGLGGIILAIVVSQNHWPWYLALLFSLAICAVVGLINAFMVVILNVPDFVATMATLNITGAIRYLILPPGTIDIALAKCGDWWVGDFSNWKFLGMPFQFWAMVIIYIIVFIIIKETKWGRKLLAIGDNREMALMSGIPVTKMRVIAYVISSCLACICGVVTTISYNAGLPAIGDGWEFKAIAGCCVGGVSLAGGKASPLGVFLGVSLVFIAESAIIFFGLPTVLKSAVQGTVMALAVIYETVMEKRKIKAE